MAEGFPQPGNVKPPTGIYVPAGWGTAWQAAVAQSRLINVVSFAASIWNGFYSSSWQRTASVAPTGIEGLFMDYLQRKYSDGGSGFMSTVSANGIFAGSASTVAATGTLGTAVGGWDSISNGPNSYCLFPHAPANGATLTDTNVRGTSIDIYWIKLGVSTNQFQYNIDGTGAVTINTGIAIDGGLGVTTITGLTDTTHSLVITAAPAGSPFIVGWRGRRAAGIIPYRMGHLGRTALDLVNGPGTTGLTGVNATTGGSSIQAWAPDLCILADMGINDLNALVPPNVFAQALAQGCAYAKAGNANCELIISMSHMGSFTDSGVRTFADGATTINTAVLTSTNAVFSLADIGAQVSGPNLPGGTALIVSLVPGTTNQVNLNKNASATASAQTYTLAGRGPLYPGYLAAARGIAEAYGAALFDFWTLGRNAWSYWNGQQFWGDGTNDGLPGTDAVHPSNLGHNYMFSTIQAALATL